MKNSIRQIRVPLELISEEVEKFREEVFTEYGFENNPFCELQHRGIGINFAFQEEIHRSDDEIMYFLKEDRAVAMLIIRRTEFNNAEITMFMTDERKLIK